MAIIDKEILAQFRDKRTQQDAFKVLVRQYSSKIYWHARRMLRNHEDANDVTQEVLVKIWSNLLNFKEESALSTWIFRITTNETISFIRKAGRHLTVAETEIPDTSSNSSESFPFNEGDTLKKLNRAIESLPVKQRQVFILRYYDEMKYEEMSEVLSTSVGALKASYHHAVKKIEQSVLND